MRTYKILSIEFVPRKGTAVPILSMDLRNTVTGMYRSINLYGADAAKNATLKVNDTWTEEK